MAAKGVRVRKRKLEPLDWGGQLGEAVEEGLGSLEHGGYLTIHRRNCGAAGGTRLCDCAVAILGPAIRDQFQ